MLKFVKKLWKPESQQTIHAPQDVSANFKLTWRTLEIGTLSLKDGKWSFKYSDAFKKQDIIKPLPDFPDIDKVYNSDELYPFFVLRLPGTGQPKVKETIEKEKIDPDNEAELLRRFGKRTIANSFILQYV
ncbi:MAG TPA: hypothetical protein ENJ20_02310 [Bacteroidetes bacterium]|nr:hypothetical protein [Bacteroidota bacterium]